MKGALLSGLWLIALAFVLAVMVWYLWRPSHVVWARNAYGMAQVGAWEGLQGFSAYVLFWFFHLRGRTVVAVLSIALWIWVFWRLFGRRIFGALK